MPSRRSPIVAPARGFTVVEVMVVLAITGILIMIAAPSFTQTIEGQRARGAGTEIYLALMRARSEAIKRNTSVTITPKSGNWANGWQIADTANASASLDDHDALPNLTVSGPASLAYLSSGRVQGSNAPAIQIEGSYPSSTRCVSVALSGEPQIKTGSC